MRWASGFLQCRAGQRLLVIIGDSGCGKSHIADALYRWASHVAPEAKWKDRIPSTLFVRWPEVAEEREAPDVLTDMLNPPGNHPSDLLVIDDVGGENDTWKVATNRLCQILSRREQMFTVITTNIQPSAWAERFDIRVADRLFRGDSIIINFEGVGSYAMRDTTPATP